MTEPAPIHSNATAHGHVPVWLALLGSGFAGMLTAIQSQINGSLSAALGDGYVAAAVSFGSGLVVLGLVTLLSCRARRGLGRLRTEIGSGRLPAWALLGGLGGALFVLNQGLIAPLTGVALFTVGIVAGQVAGGLVIDRIGLGPGGRIPPTPMRLIGTALAIIGVAIAAGVGGGGHPVLVLVPVAVGFCVSAQSSVNGLVRAASRSAVTATFVNFVIGSTVLFAAAAVSVAIHGWPQQWPGSPLLYSGGFLGTIFIAIAAVLVRVAGVLLLSMSNVAGQLIASIGLEVGMPLSDGLTTGLVVGCGISLVAVAIAALPRRGSRTR